MKKFQFLLICILTFMINLLNNFDINIRPINRTIEYNYNFFDIL